MAGDDRTAALLDEFAALNPEQRRDLAWRLRAVADTCREVPDGQQTAYVLGLLARFLDPPKAGAESEEPLC